MLNSLYYMKIGFTLAGMIPGSTVEVMSINIVATTCRTMLTMSGPGLSKESDRYYV
jgi:hypothetical protein